MAEGTGHSCRIMPQVNDRGMSQRLLSGWLLRYHFGNELAEGSVAFTLFWSCHSGLDRDGFLAFGEDQDDTPE